MKEIKAVPSPAALREAAALQEKIIQMQARVRQILSGSAQTKPAPAKAAKAAKAAPAKKKMSAAARKKISQRAKERWAAAKKAGRNKL